MSETGEKVGLIIKANIRECPVVVVVLVVIRMSLFSTEPLICGKEQNSVVNWWFMR